MTTLAAIRRNALRSLIRRRASHCRNGSKPTSDFLKGVSALLGAIRLYPYQREIADAMKAGVQG
jgi:hypothetical protein